MVEVLNPQITQLLSFLIFSDDKFAVIFYNGSRFIRINVIKRREPWSKFHARYFWANLGEEYPCEPADGAVQLRMASSTPKVTCAVPRQEHVRPFFSFHVSKHKSVESYPQSIFH